MNKRILPFLAFIGALITAVSCSEEKVIDNSPPFVNKLTINSNPQQRVVASCNQGLNNTINATFQNNGQPGSIGLTFAGGASPGAGNYDIVLTPPQQGQVRIHMVPNSVLPAQSYVADSGQTISISMIQGSAVVSLLNINMRQSGASSSVTVTGTLGCYINSGSGNVPNLNIPNNTLTLGTDSTATLTAACSTTVNNYMIMGSGTSAGNVVSAIFIFPSGNAPLPGAYTVATTGYPQAGQVSFSVVKGGAQYQATGGQTVVTLEGGAPKVSFSNISLRQVGATATILATGSVACNGSTGTTTSGTTTSGSTTTGGTTSGTNSNFLVFNGSNQTLTGAQCNADSTYFTSRLGFTDTNGAANVTVKFTGGGEPAAGNFALSAAGGQPAQAVVMLTTNNTGGMNTYTSTSGTVTVTKVGGKTKATFNNIPVQMAGGSHVTLISGSVICP